MNQYSVTFLISFLNEVVNFLCHLIMVIEDKLSSVNYDDCYLSIVVKPVKGQVLNSHRSPLIENLPSCTVYYMSYFVCYYEL